jgi:hypothetical protein
MYDIFPLPPEHYKEFQNHPLQPPKLPSNPDQNYYCFGKVETFQRNFSDLLKQKKEGLIPD